MYEVVAGQEMHELTRKQKHSLLNSLVCIASYCMLTLEEVNRAFPCVLDTAMKGTLFLHCLISIFYL